jgi:hypothetical protein
MASTNSLFFTIIYSIERFFIRSSIHEHTSRIPSVHFQQPKHTFLHTMDILFYANTSRLPCSHLKQQQHMFLHTRTAYPRQTHQHLEMPIHSSLKPCIFVPGQPFSCKKGCPWDARACRLAAKEGHLEVLKYLHEQGCPRDAFTFAWAEACDRLEVLKYLYEKGCPRT